MYPTAGFFVSRSGVMKIPLMTMLQRLESSPGNRPGNAVSTSVAFTFQNFPIALARSMSKPTALPLVVLYSMGGKVGSLQYLNEPLTGEAAPTVPTTARAAIKARMPIGPKLRFMAPPN